MAAKKKTTRQRVPRTRAGETWTEAKFWGWIRSALRRASTRWPPIYQAKNAARRKFTGKKKSQKWEYQCSHCKRWRKGTEVQVDHIEPCGSLKSWEDIGPFCRRLFVEADGLRVLCKPCHHIVTHGKK